MLAKDRHLSIQAQAIFNRASILGEANRKDAFEWGDHSYSA